MGWFNLVYLGLESLGVFLVFVFHLFRFCFGLFWFCFCFVVGLLLVLFLLCFFVFVFFFLFLFVLEGWPKGPPLLALNLPFFLFFVFVWRV